MKNKRVILFTIFITLLIAILAIELKDTHSYYLDTNNLSLVSSKIGKFGSIEKSDIKKDAGGQLQDTAVFGLYRYYGTKDTVKNNYICFGTNNKDTCLGDPNTYMYRIIGITDNSTTNTDLGIPGNSLKIIKATAYGNTYAWNETSGATWDTASVNTTVLNSTFYNTISEINNGINWKKDIILSNHYWWIGDISPSGSEKMTSNLYNNWAIGLMYQSDYYNANIKQNTETWLFEKDSSNNGEWTMSRQNSGTPIRTNPLNGYLWLDGSDGMSRFNKEMIRPAFYLIPEISLKGTGADRDPYLINY